MRRSLSFPLWGCLPEIYEILLNSLWIPPLFALMMPLWNCLQILNQPIFYYGARSETSGDSAASSLISVRGPSFIHRTSIRLILPPCVHPRPLSLPGLLLSIRLIVEVSVITTPPSSRTPLFTSCSCFRHHNSSSTSSHPALGLAKIMHEDEEGRMVLTKDLDGAGTVTHQAPELFRENDKAGASVDMFALGIMVRGRAGRGAQLTQTPA